MDKTNTLDIISMLNRISDMSKKILSCLEKLIWIALAVDGALAFIVIMRRDINLIELTITRPVLIQACLFCIYVAVVAFLALVTKIHRKSYGSFLIRVLVYLGLDWMMINLLMMIWPYVISVIS